jgi:hypothetical protein
MVKTHKYRKTIKNIGGDGGDGGGDGGDVGGDGKIPTKTKTKTKRKSKLTMNDITKCHPSKKSTNTTIGCLPSEVYSELQKKVGVSDINSLYSHLGCKHGEDHCLLNKLPQTMLDSTLNKQLRKLHLRPKKPSEWEKDPDAWLDNFTIENVMKQYEDAYKWFKLLGVFPIDFSSPDPSNKNKCLYEETCDINLLDEYNKGIRGIGTVFNLDPHDKSGSHWVAMYINIHNIKKPFISYFDSYGYKTPPRIAQLMTSFKGQIKGCQFGYNGRRFQFGHSECGMFSMYFIICMIHGIKFKKFCKDSVDDAFMLNLRHSLLSN